VLRNSKTLIRKEKIKQLSQLKEAEKKIKAYGAQNQLLKLSAFKEANSIALYAAYQNEVPTDAIFEWCRASQKKLCFPTIQSNRLLFYRVHQLSELRPTLWGFGAPNTLGSKSISLDEIDLMIIPGIAFDCKLGTRLGRGKGFYDQTLSHFSGIRIGLCYEFQLVESLPYETWDQPMNYVVTERNCYGPF